MRTFVSDQVTADAAGNVVGGVQLTVWDSMKAGVQVTDLYDYFTDAPLPGYVTTQVTPPNVNDVGRPMFASHNDAYGLLFLDRGYGERWPVVALEVWPQIAVAASAAVNAAASAAAAEQSASDSAASSASAVSIAQATQAQQDQYAGQSATVDELAIANRMPGTAEWALFVAPYACTLTDLIASFSGYALSGSTNTATLELAKWDASGIRSVICSKSTSEEALTAWLAWDLSGAAWANQQLAAGDVVTAKITTTGTVTGLPNPLLTLRYRPDR